MKLTNLFDEVAERGALETRPGQAHWAGSGPPGKKCKDCVHFGGSSKKPGRCALFANHLKANLQRTKAPKFSGAALSCKHFEAKP